MLKFELDLGGAGWTVFLLVLSVTFAVGKRIIRNTVKFVSALWCALGWHKNGIWRNGGKLQLLSMNPNTGNLEWAKYPKKKIFVWIRQWAFQERRWRQRDSTSQNQTRIDVARIDDSSDSAMHYLPGFIQDEPSDGADEIRNQGERGDISDTTSDQSECTE